MSLSRRELLKNWKGKGKKIAAPVQVTRAKSIQIPSKVLQAKNDNVIVEAPKKPVAKPAVVKSEKPVIAAKQPVVAAKQTVVAAKQPVVAAKQPVVAAKQPVVAAKQPVKAEKPEKPWLKGRKAQKQTAKQSISRTTKAPRLAKPSRSAITASKPSKKAASSSKSVTHQSFVGNGSFRGSENVPPPAPALSARSGPTVHTVRSDSPHVSGGMMMMFSPPSHVNDTVISKERYAADRESHAARNNRVEQMKSEGLLMNFSPPQRVQAVEKAKFEARPKKPIFGMTFTPGGTLQGGDVDMDNTPEELRKMRERIRIQEMKERGETEEETQQESQEDLAAYLGDDMEAEISIDPATPSAASVESRAATPETFVSGIDYGTPAAKTPNYKVVQVIDTKMVDELEETHEELERARGALTSTEGQNDELSEALRLATEEKENLAFANAKLVKRVQQLEEDDLNLEKASADLNSELQALRRENESLKKDDKERMELRKQVDGLKKIVKDLTAASKEREAKSSETVSSLRAVNASLKKQVSDWKGKVGSMQKAKDNGAKEELVKAELELDKAREEIIGANSTIAALETRVSTLDANVVVLETSLQGTQKQLADLKAKEGSAEDKFSSELKSKRSTIEHLESKIRAVQTKLEAESKKNLALQAKCGEEVKARNVEKQKLSKLMEQVNSYSCKSEELVSALAGEKDGNKLMKRKLEQAIKDKEAAMERVRTFDEREMELVRKLNFMDEVRKTLHNRVLQLTGNIRVFVRVRPALMPEQEAMNAVVVKGRGAPRPEIPFKFFDVCDGAEGIDKTKRLLEVQEPWKDRGGLNPRRKKWKFGFDSVFGPSEGQDEVWEAAEPLVQSAIDGHNVTFFAYGQVSAASEAKSEKLTKCVIVYSYLYLLSSLLLADRQRKDPYHVGK